MRQGKTIAETHGLSVGYVTGSKRIAVMEKLSLSARHGELVALIGRNGSGKSTLLRTIVGLQPALEGTVEIGGKELSPSLRHLLPRLVSYTSTEPLSVHNVRVREAVSLGRFPYTNWLGSLSEEDQSVVDEALRSTDLLSLAERNIDQISDGERQRTLIARSLAQDTDLLVMDEPTAFLDLPSRFSVVSLLKKLTREKGKCVVYSTHDLDTAINEADKIWLMHDRGVNEGAPEDLILGRIISGAFESPQITFSPSTATFSFVREKRGAMALEASGMIRKMTERALHRYGFTTDPSSAVKITVGTAENITVWHLSGCETEGSYFSLYELLGHLPDEGR